MRRFCPLPYFVCEETDSEGLDSTLRASRLVTAGSETHSLVYLPVQQHLAIWCALVSVLREPSSRAGQDHNVRSPSGGIRDTPGALRRETLASEHGG